MQRNVVSRPCDPVAWTAIGSFVLLIVAFSGCAITAPNDNDNQNNNTNNNTNGNDNASGRIVSFTSNFGISQLSPPISVIYEVTTTPDGIAAFYVPVDGPEQNAPSIGVRVIIENDLPAGMNRSFDFDPGDAGVGFFRVGLIITDNNEEEIIESRGVIEVQGPPDPRFILPAAALTQVLEGGEVDISIDAGDPQGIVQWRVFYLRPADSRDNPPHLLGVTLGTGSGNFGEVAFNTTGLIPGDYELGVAATDSGESVATTGESGDANLIIVFPSTGETGPVIRVGS